MCLPVLHDDKSLENEHFLLLVSPSETHARPQLEERRCCSVIAADWFPLIFLRGSQNKSEWEGLLPGLGENGQTLNDKVFGSG